MCCIHTDDEFFLRIKQLVAEALKEAGFTSSQQKPPTYKPDQLLTEHQVAELLGISVRTLQSWRNQVGKGPRPQKIGSLVRYLYSDVARLINGNEPGSIEK